MISTKGRYALRFLVDIARHDALGSVSLKDSAERQEISAKYLEAISAMLCRGGLVRSQRGKSGGYRLSRPAEEISAAEVLCLTEGSLAPVNCIEDGKSICGRACECATLPMWRALDKLIDDYLSGISIQDLALGRVDEINTKQGSD